MRLTKFGVDLPPRRIPQSGMIVDFDAVRENAKKQRVDLCHISIFYENLTQQEIEAMNSAKALAEGSTGVGRFLDDGSVMYPEKATAVYSLTSD